MCVYIYIYIYIYITSSVRQVVPPKTSDIMITGVVWGPYHRGHTEGPHPQQSNLIR